MIERQAIEPRRKARLPGKQRQLLISANEDFLGEVFRRFVAARHSVREAIGARVITFIDVRKHLGLAGEHEADQFLICACLDWDQRFTHFVHTSV